MSLLARMLTPDNLHHFPVDGGGGQGLRHSHQGRRASRRSRLVLRYSTLASTVFGYKSSGCRDQYHPPFNVTSLPPSPPFPASKTTPPPVRNTTLGSRDRQAGRATRMLGRRR